MVVLPMFDLLQRSRFSIYVNSSLLTHISVHHRLMKRGFTDIFTYSIDLDKIAKVSRRLLPGTGIPGLWNADVCSDDDAHSNNVKGYEP